MASGQDKSDSGGGDGSLSSNVDCDELHKTNDGVEEIPKKSKLSVRAVEIKRKIDAGTYRIDLPALAESILRDVDDPSRPLPQPQNDEEQKDS